MQCYSLLWVLTLYLDTRISFSLKQDHMCEYHCRNLSFVCHPVIYLFMYSHNLFHKTFEQQHRGRAAWILNWSLVKWLHDGMLFGRSCQTTQRRSEQCYAAVLWRWCQMPTRKLKHLVAWIKIFSFQQSPVAWTDIVINGKPLLICLISWNIWMQTCEAKLTGIWFKSVFLPRPL